MFSRSKFAYYDIATRSRFDIAIRHFDSRIVSTLAMLLKQLAILLVDFSSSLSNYDDIIAQKQMIEQSIDYYR